MDSYTAANTPSESTFAVLLGLFGTFFIVFVAIAVIWYVLQALGYYKLAKNRNISYAWISWIPICQDYLLGDLIGNEVWGFGHANWILVIGTIIASICASFATETTPVFLLVVMMIYVIVFYVYRMTALYRLYQIYSDHAVLYLVLSIIFHFLTPVFIFIIRNNEPKRTA